MINYYSSNLSVSVFTYDYTQVNLQNYITIPWNFGLIVFGAFYNYLDQDFAQLYMYDSNGSDILHLGAPRSLCYTIGYSGNNSGSPLHNNNLADLNEVRFDYNIATIGSGKLIVKLYYI
jgi:hypothetical protein